MESANKNYELSIMNYELKRYAHSYPLFRLKLRLFEIVHPHAALFVQHGIREVGNPVAEDEDTALTREHQVELDVTMAEDEIVDGLLGMLLHVLLGKDHNRLLVLAHEVGQIIAIDTRMAAPAMTYGRGNVGMYPAADHLAETIVEEARHQLQG